MKVLSIVGARPEFVQAAPLSRAIRARHHEVLVHTGQHYDAGMSDVFFEELELPQPEVNLGVGSGAPCWQVAQTLERLEPVILRERPDFVLVRGDTNSTLAGTLAAVKLSVPLVHVEAGERSFDRSMPEEHNRLVADRLADHLFCASRTAMKQLAAEGITSHVHWVGDVMLDVLTVMQPIARARSTILERLGLDAGRYVLVTVHRAANTDDPGRLAALVTAFNAAKEPIVFPVHPRCATALTGLGVALEAHIHVVPPVGYLDMLALQMHARLVATDSGGVQREAYNLGVRCLTLRDSTEWTETQVGGWNTLVGADPARILEAWRAPAPPHDRPPIFGDGQAAQKIVRILERGAGQ